MPRGKRETKFFAVVEPKKGNRPNIHVFDSTPEFKIWLGEEHVTLGKKRKEDTIMWCELNDGRWCALIKGHNLGAFAGQLVKV